MIIRLLSTIILTLVGFGVIAHADHLPENLQARGNPEKRIAGINLERSKLVDIIRLYGQPTKVKAWEQDNPKIANSYEYYWIKQDVYLKVVLHRIANLEYIGLVEVKGPANSGRIGRTGAGLRLGHTLNDLMRIYGKRLQVRDIPKLQIHDVMVQWRLEEYSLVATLDRHNQIASLALAAPE